METRSAGFSVSRRTYETDLLQSIRSLEFRQPDLIAIFSSSRRDTLFVISPGDTGDYIDVILIETDPSSSTRTSRRIIWTNPSALEWRAVVVSPDSNRAPRDRYKSRWPSFNGCCRNTWTPLLMTNAPWNGSSAGDPRNRTGRGSRTRLEEILRYISNFWRRKMKSGEWKGYAWIA